MKGNTHDHCSLRRTSNPSLPIPKFHQISPKTKYLDLKFFNFFLLLVNRSSLALFWYPRSASIQKIQLNGSSNLSLQISSLRATAVSIIWYIQKKMTKSTKRLENGAEKCSNRGRGARGLMCGPSGVTIVLCGGVMFPLLVVVVLAILVLPQMLLPNPIHGDEISQIDLHLELLHFVGKEFYFWKYRRFLEWTKLSWKIQKGNNPIDLTTAATIELVQLSEQILFSVEDWLDSTDYPEPISDSCDHQITLSC